MRKAILWAFYSIFTLILTLTLSVTAFVNFSPQFGSNPSSEDQQRFATTGRFVDGQFQNIDEFELKLDCHSIQEMFKKALTKTPNLSPSRDIRVLPYALQSLPHKGTKITWLGHSSFLIETANKVILIDPIFSSYAAPHPWLGVNRYSSQMPITIKDIPSVDFVLISHDHYDHLDYESILQLRSKVKTFMVPLGVGSHLQKWGVSTDRIIEMDWWQEKSFKPFHFVFAPSKHMSGRGLTNQKSTLWGSWLIQFGQNKIYFSGDSGYGSHFRQIREKFGPVDIALLENGQYDDLWPDVHMTPEQAVQASIDLSAKLVIPVHWAAFTLANHSWTDPIERITEEAIKQGVAVSTPQIGETVELGSLTFPQSEWWTAYK